MKVIDQTSGENWTLYQGDSITVMRGIPDNSVHYIIKSPPFSSLYTFSDDPRDVSNNSDEAVFFEHYGYLIREMYRAMMPGRLCSTHLMQLPTSITRDGFIGIRDFRGEIVKAYCGNEAAEMWQASRRLRARAGSAQYDGDTARAAKLRDMAEALDLELKTHPGERGFIMHSELMIRKDPVAAATRSKSIGLLHKQMKKDSALSRQALADYVVTFRKPGVNPEPVSGLLDDSYLHEKIGQSVVNWERRRVNHTPETRSIAVWQRIAESVWLDIAQGDTLSRKLARDEADEAHISPLQLTVVRRCIDLWSNEGDVVLSPFAGIGTELYCAVEMGRRAIGVELKRSYYEQAVKNLGTLVGGQRDMFATSGIITLTKLVEV